MELYSWLLFVSLIGVASISPGPNVLLVVTATLREGISGALYTVCGNLAALFTIALVAALGVGAVLEAAPTAFTIMKFAGGAYLAWIGVGLIRSSFKPLPPLSLDCSGSAPSLKSRIRLMGSAMLVSYSNPKSILFLSAVFPSFLDTGADVPLQFAIMFATIVCIVGVIHVAYAIVALHMRDALLSNRSRKWMSRVAGGSFLGIGLGLAVDTQRS